MDLENVEDIGIGLMQLEFLLEATCMASESGDIAKVQTGLELSQNLLKDIQKLTRTVISAAQTS